MSAQDRPQTITRKQVKPRFGQTCLVIVDHLRLNVTDNVPSAGVMDAAMVMNLYVVGIARGVSGFESRTSFFGSS